MCGVIIIAGYIDAKAEAIFKQMLEVGSVRGRHSTGVVKVSSTGVVETRKKAVHGADFVKLEGTWISSGFNKLLIGHNRWATKGAVTDLNAHPFSHGKIHGCHNGTLDKQYLLPESHKFEVDSDNLIYSINKIGLEETLTKLSGAFTVPFYDEETKLFTVFRNDQRELAMCYSADMKTLFMCSEELMLQWVLERNGVPTKHVIDLKDNIKITLNPFAVKMIDTVVVEDNLEFHKPVIWNYVPKKKETGTEKKGKPLDDLDEDEELDAFGNNVADLFSYLDEVVCKDKYDLPMTKRNWLNTDACKYGCSICGNNVQLDTEFEWHHDGTNAYCDECVPFKDRV